MKIILSSVTKVPQMSSTKSGKKGSIPGPPGAQGPAGDTKRVISFNSGGILVKESYIDVNSQKSHPYAAAIMLDDNYLLSSLGATLSVGNSDTKSGYQVEILHKPYNGNTLSSLKSIKPVMISSSNIVCFNNVAFNKGDIISIKTIAFGTPNPTVIIGYLVLFKNTKP